jgi:RND superfamily putative drug exporter
MLVRIADWCYRARRLVVAAWVAALVGAFLLAGAFGGEFRQDYLQPGSESKAVSDTLTATFPQRAGDTVQIVVHAAAGVSTPEAKSLAEKVFANVSRNKHVVGIVSPFTAEGAAQISADGTTAYADVALDKSANEYTPQEAKALVDPVLAASTDTVQLEVGGPVAALSQTIQVGSEGIGLIAAAIILLVTFGSAVAMGLPLLTAVFGLGTAMALSEVLRRVIDIPDWAPNAAAMVGLGVGIDYALLIVTRFRSSIADGQEPREASATAIATAGRAVLFAGLTVVASMLGILLMAQAAMTGFAVTVILVVLVTMTASVTLLPAVLGFSGRNIERLHVPFVRKEARLDGTSRWYRWSRFIQHRPWLAAISGLAVLLALAAPLMGIRFGTPDAKNDPPNFTTRQAFELLADGFGPGFSAPILITVQGPTGAELLESADKVAVRLGQVAGVAYVAPALVNPAADTALLRLIPDSAPQDAVTEDLVDTLRDDTIPATTQGTGLSIGVGGLVAANMDSTRAVTHRLPLFFGGVLLLSFVLLMMVFRSLVVPLKAVVMNLLASAAAFGVLTLAVSGGQLGDLVGIPESTPVPIQLPIGIFAILFGLSMDYEVFLLSRIKEEYDRTGDNAVAVADGLAKSARVITAGAAIMVTVFLAFVLGDAVLGKMFGIGLAAAILIDATIIRMVLVPATMELLGDRNWWLPSWLDRLLPTITVEGHGVGHQPDAVPTAATAPQPSGVGV